MSTVRLERLAKRFGTTTVVSDVSLEVAEGELVALLGPSGSGKTTLLRLIAGFETVDAGRIFLDGDDVTTRPALERRCGMVFQHYALFPHLSVGANVGYGLANERLAPAARDARIAEVLAMVDMTGYETRAVSALSGGQQQRVALARALAPRPRVLLLDEPLSNLDPSLRERTRRELRELVRRTGITTVLVTHEQEEAFDLADRIALLHQGRLEQLGAPDELYDMPATPFVAGFVGRTSALHGRVVGHDADHVRVLAAGAEWRARAAAGLAADVVLLVRPEGARFAVAGPIAGTVLRRRFAGAAAFFAVRLADASELEIAASPDAAREGDAVTLEPTGLGAHAWAVTSGATSA
jgi:putative spermidine/putrescine transport system ATP-binding protein